ncbi:MAG: hypothetical protein RW306_17040 [Geobacteraceae bacterium]|nr:hypothetical protein [Geobacteraceae bacterium]
MGTVKKNSKRKLKSHASVRMPRQETLTVVTLRISDDEKEQIDRIMDSWNIKRYSDVMRMAVRMLKTGAIQ